MGLGPSAVRSIADHFSQQLLYAGQLIGVIVQGLSKFSVILLISRISRATASKGITLYIKIVVGLWTLFSVLAIGLQCGVTAPWVFDRDRCVARGSLYYVVIALNIATDAFLAVFFIPGVLKLQMSKTLHFVISSLFAVRLMYVLAPTNPTPLRAPTPTRRTWIHPFD